MFKFKSKSSTDSADNIFVKLSYFFFRHSVLSVIFWLALIVASVVIYTNLIKKDGFPPIQFPVTVINGYYSSENSTATDTDIVQPLLSSIDQLPAVKSTTSEAYKDAFVIVVEFDDSVESEAGTTSLQQIIDQNSNLLPSELRLNYLTINPAKFLYEYDVLLSLYSLKTDVTSDELQALSLEISQRLQADDQIAVAEPQKLIEIRYNSFTDQVESFQNKINHLGLQDEDLKLNFYPSITIGIAKPLDSKLDTLNFAEHLKEQIDQLNLKAQNPDFDLIVLADFAETVDEQLNSLETNLTTALIAVVIVSFLLISWRASIITALFIISTILISITIMYIIGHSLNVISLFSLILALGLLVDDATIIVEVIEAHRRRLKDKASIIKESIKRVALASLAGTTTTILVFVPLLFVTGILGEFIRILPITIIIALISSFVLSLILIPVLSKFILLRQTKLDWLTRHNPISHLEKITANFLASRILDVAKKGLKTKLFPIMMILISIFMIISAQSFFAKVEFDIFPAAKDGNALYYRFNFNEGNTLAETQQALDEIHQSITDSIEPHVKQISYLNVDTQSAEALIDLSRYQDRQVTSLELVEQLNLAVESNLSNQDIQYEIRAQGGGGPPDQEFPIEVRIFTSDQTQAQTIAQDINNYALGTDIKLANGQTAKVIESKLPNLTNINRIDSRQAYTLGLKFDSENISSLIEPTTQHIKTKFDADYLKAYGLTANDLKIDAGAESDNLESFNMLGIAALATILMMYLLLVALFRSWLRPFLILMAIPFAMFGIGAGLYLTDNPISFFSMLGVISILGIAVNNTILFTDYMNQELRKGRRITEAIAIATQDRFRPLITTSLTTIVALLPLALNDPFWQALSYTIIFGLFSSTLLVVLAFPYYCLIVEYLRQKLSRQSK